MSVGTGGGGTRRGLLAKGLVGGLGGALALAQGACSAPGAPAGGGAGGSGKTASGGPATIRLIERLDQESQALDARLPAFKEKFPQMAIGEIKTQINELLRKA